MSAWPTTIVIRGHARPRFAAGCAACGVSDAADRVRFAGAKVKEEESSSNGFDAALMVTEVVASIASAILAALLIVGLGTWLSSDLGDGSASTFDVPLCARCAAEVRARRNVDRALATATALLLALVLVGFFWRDSAPWISRAWIGAIVALLATVTLHVALRARARAEERLGVERAVGVVRFRFADADAARRFEAANRA